jgi:cytochrome c6
VPAARRNRVTSCHAEPAVVRRRATGYNDGLPSNLERALTSSFGGRARRLVSAAALIAGAAVAACGGSAPAAKSNTVDAKALFAQACAKCHAEDGSGGLPTAANGPRPADLRSAEWQASRIDAELMAAIRTGRGAMPPFEDVLSADQIAALGAYVRSLKQP